MSEDQRAPEISAEEYTDSLGVDVRRHQVAARLLADGRDDTEIIRRSRLSRRELEELRTRLRAESSDSSWLVGESGSVEHANEVYGGSLLSLAGLRYVGPPVDLVHYVSSLRGAAPGPRSELDHVPATDDTVARRAVWMSTALSLDGARVLFLGDHDLTSVAFAKVVPSAHCRVVDIDDDLLSFLVKSDHDKRITPLYSDLRLFIPETVSGWADVVLTDPPYSEAGVELFLRRAVESLREPAKGRILLAHGFSALTPKLGWKVQKVIGRLQLVIDAMLPFFNSYSGAEAIGSTASLYVLRPVGNRHPSPRRDRTNPFIYSRGPFSVEAERSPSAAEKGRGIAKEGVERMLDPTRLNRLAHPSKSAKCTFADLRGDPGGWLRLLLLALNDDAITCLVDSDSETRRRYRWAQSALEPKYALLSVSPTPGGEMLEWERKTSSSSGSAVESVMRHVLERSHGKLRRTIVDGIAAVSNTRRRAASEALVGAAAGWERWLSCRPIECPSVVLDALPSLVSETIAEL